MADSAHPGKSNRKTVLVVEDSPTQALHIQALLEQHGLHVMCAGDGWAGVRAARQSHPDLILLDLQMPGLNGFQVYQELKKADDTAAIPVIMFTRRDDPEAVLEGMEIGVTDYIPKDAFADAVLVQTLRQMGLIAKR